MIIDTEKYELAKKMYLERKYKRFASLYGKL
jgi:hypothetical protein